MAGRLSGRPVCVADVLGAPGAKDTCGPSIAAPKVKAAVERPVQKTLTRVWKAAPPHSRILRERARPQPG